MSVRLSSSRFTTYLPLLVLMGIGMFLVWYGTVWGAGLISDSFQYTASARNLVAGNGFSLPYGNGELEPMTKYPPMFSVLLAGFELLGIKALLAARVANIVLFGVNVILVFLCTQKLTRSHAFSLFAALLFSISAVLLEVHSWALSEPLYICLGLAAILSLQHYFEESKLSQLILASVFVSLAFLTRYVGLSLVVSVALVMLINSARRFRDLLLFGSIATLPMVLWTLRGFLLTQTLNDRVISFHPLTKKNIASAADVVYGWFFPSTFVQGEEKLLLALTAIAVVLILFLIRKFYKLSVLDLVKDPDPRKKIVLLHLLYASFYMLMIIASKTWLDADIGLSDRILSPMLVSLLIVMAAGFSFLWNAFDKTRPIIVLLGLALSAYYMAGTFVTVQAFHDGGIGIARRGWNRSEVIQSLRSYSSYTMYTNSNSTLYLWSDRTGYSVLEFEALKATGTDMPVLLVIFHHVPPTGKRLNELISGLELLGEDQIISVYKFAP